MLKVISQLCCSVLFMFLLVGFFFANVNSANAAQFTRAYLRIDRMKASTTTGGTVCAQWASTAPTDNKIKVTFPAGFVVNSTAGNWTVNTTNLPAGSTAMPGITTASVVSGQVVTFPISNITSNSTLYCFNFSGTNTLTTSTAGVDKTGTIQATTSADAEIDIGSYATAVITDDQIVITATVPSTFTMTLSSNTQALGILTTGSVTSGTGVAMSIITNAANGWISWVRSFDPDGDPDAQLYSVATGDSIPTTGTVDGTPSTISAGTKGYVLDADLTLDSGTAGSGTVAIAPEYNGVSTSAGGALSTIFTEFASANGPTDTDTITLVPRVSISGLTRAATDYSDTLTVVAAGSF